MDFRAFAEKHFKQAVGANLDISGELRQKLLGGNYPRINTYLDNMAKQLQDAQNRRLKKGKSPWDLSQLAWAVKETTGVFICGIELAAQKMYQTEAERLRKEAEAQNQKDMDSTLNGKPSGVFEEMGLVINDKSQTLEKV